MAATEQTVTASHEARGAGGGLPRWMQRIHPAAWLLIVFLLFLPAFANDFIQLQIFGWAFVLGMISLSLMFLAGYGGMVSLVQMTVAGCAGYVFAILGHSAAVEISLGWPWWATSAKLRRAVRIGARVVHCWARGSNMR